MLLNHIRAGVTTKVPDIGLKNSVLEKKYPSEGKKVLNKLINLAII